MNAQGELSLQHLDAQQRNELADEVGIDGQCIAACKMEIDHVQPTTTLWCMNIMAFKIRVVPTFTLLLCHLLAAHFNFDFDGDKLIVHAPQDLMALASMPLMSPLRYIMNPVNGTLIMAPTLNTPMGAHLMTEAKLLLKEDAVHRMLAAAQRSRTCRFRARLTELDMRTSMDIRCGRVVMLSTLLPPTCFLRSRCVGFGVRIGLSTSYLSMMS